MPLERAKRYLNNVLKKQEAIPFKGGVAQGGPGRHAQAKGWKTSQCGWPIKAVRAFLDLIRNAESNANFRNLNVRKLVVAHAHANQAALIRRRTFRAHGRINAYMSSPAHLEVVLEEKAEQTEAAPALEEVKNE
jgi:large subunit ribosomal protein L17e